jgi:predicted nucleotidyltransferase
MAIPKNILYDNPGLGNWSILTGFRGSIAHGMYVPQNDPSSIDDKDVMAICIPPIDYYFGLPEFGNKGTKEIMIDEWDIVIYEFKKFIKMLCQGNPNVLSLLWLERGSYIKLTPAGEELIRQRSLFAGRHVYHSFTGYAYGQMHRMEHGSFNGYMGAKRKKLVEQFGYDCKNAAHLIRLLRMGIEFLKDGELYVKREDAPQLLAIKRGEWPLARVKEEAERLFKMAEEVYVKSTLPKGPDLKKINVLSVEILSSVQSPGAEWWPR